MNVEIDASASQASGAVSQPVFDILLTNLTGTRMLRTTGRGNDITQLNVSNIPNGIYVLHVYDGTGTKPETQRIVISH
ncbi:MAG: T9SS type A sorting domain-containing protein [Tannerella sp.]|nr:T9SS type A sorting domain-containing protein [Tannerella sp.]